MCTPEQILKALTKAKATAQAPMALSNLALACGMNSQPLQDLLEGMYQHHPKLVNRAEITRLGFKQWFYWPTGVIVSFKGDLKAAQQHYGSQRVSLNSRPPRRSETKPQATPAQTIEASVEKEHRSEPEEIMSTENTADTKVLAAKTIPLLMLEYIEQHPNCQGGMLRKAANAGTVGSYLDRYLKTGDVIKEVHGPRDARYRLKKDMTAELIYSAPKGKRGAHNKKPAIQSIVSQSIPAFLRKENADSVKPTQGNVATLDSNEKPVLIHSDDLDLASIKEAGPGSIMREEKPARRVRFAITSDLTLMIIGATPEPIELTTAESDLLDKFLNSSFVSMGETA